MGKRAGRAELQAGADLVLVGHGVVGACAPGAERTHEGLVATLRAKRRFNQIRWGYLSCEPCVEEVTAGLRSATVKVLPMLMCDGHFAKTELPRKLGLHGLVTCRPNGQKIVRFAPIGLSQKMSKVMAAHMLDYCHDNEMRPHDTAVIVIGHGSSSNPASRLAVDMQVANISRLQRFRDVHAAFLDEAPALPAVLRGVQGKALVMGYFANRGHHATKDVCAMMRDSGSAAKYLGPVGALPGISEVVMDCVESAGP